MLAAELLSNQRQMSPEVQNKGACVLSKGFMSSKSLETREGEVKIMC